MKEALRGNKEGTDGGRRENWELPCGMCRPAASFSVTTEREISALRVFLSDNSLNKAGQVTGHIANVHCAFIIFFLAGD